MFFFQAICTTIAAAIHYFFLVSFCWMLIEGLTLYYKVVKVFDTDFKIWPFCAFSWGKFNPANDDKKTSKSTWSEIN